MFKRKFHLYIERAFWLAGVVILGHYGSLQFIKSAQAEMDIAQFHKSQNYTQTDTKTTKTDTLTVDTELKLDATPANYSLWSKSAKEKYQKLSKSDAPIAIMEIERLSMKVPIFPGASDDNMDRGAGWVSHTAFFDEPDGNIGIAGHRDSWFRSLKDVQIGDTISVQTNSGTELYTVFQTKIVKPNNVDVLRFTPSKQLTLVTCYPFYFLGDAPERFIVMANPLN